MFDIMALQKKIKGGVQMLHENLRARRLRLKMTLQDLSDIVGISKGTLSKYETGHISNIDTKTIVKLADALNCEPSQLMGWESLPQTANKKLDELITLCYTLDDSQLDLIISTVQSYKAAWNARD